MDPWQDVRDQAGHDLRTEVYEVVRAASSSVAEQLCAALRHEGCFAGFREPQALDERLRAAIRSWLRVLFDPQRKVGALHAVQRTAGQLHARIGVPKPALRVGARWLKRALSLRIEAADTLRGNRAVAVRYVHEAVDLALEQMAAVHAADEHRLARAEAAYRHLYLSQNLQAERERQRALLGEWALDLLLRPDPPGEAAPSPFGLWLRHKAGVVFEGAPELAWIDQRLREVERQWLPRWQRARGPADGTRELRQEIHAAMASMRQWLAALFDLAAEAPGASGPVARLLHRRYLPVVARREILQSQRSGDGFALVLLEVDQFDQLAAALGSHDAELVAAQVAALLIEGVRAGDSVFRLGDRRFAALLVELRPEQARPVASALKQQVEAATFGTTTAARTQVTLTLGLAVHDGHPDFHRLLQRAEQALRDGRPGAP